MAIYVRGYYAKQSLVDTQIQTWSANESETRFSRVSGKFSFKPPPPPLHPPLKMLIDFRISKIAQTKEPGVPGISENQR